MAIAKAIMGQSQIRLHERAGGLENRPSTPLQIWILRRRWKITQGEKGQVGPRESDWGLHGRGLPPAIKRTGVLII